MCKYLCFSAEKDSYIAIHSFKVLTLYTTTNVHGRMAFVLCIPSTVARELIKCGIRNSGISKIKIQVLSYLLNC